MICGVREHSTGSQGGHSFNIALYQELSHPGGQDRTADPQAVLEAAVTCLEWCQGKFRLDFGQRFFPQRVLEPQKLQEGLGSTARGAGGIVGVCDPDGILVLL